ncbi:MAG: hypothetical protein SFV55_22630 [Haliscomenobacter sp.]|uniref:hypothetical protein n=1 Tax=Haliscomenobacter sp. TaxID=2717303 RepID=UPI0029BFA53D|nr:hypothetical protein [Haliscomenobacter sp.]MDX2071243.1 hypothetical protein [Haliscomenobacter sp.]
MYWLQILLYGAYTYLALGLIFGLWFVFKGAEQIDENMHGASRATRLLLLPASIALWVVLLNKWLKQKKHGS